MKYPVRLFFLAALLTTIFAACNKNDDDPTGPDPQLMAVHASPNSPAFNFYLDNTKFNSQPLAFLANTAYTTVTPKNYNVKVTAANNITPLIEIRANLQRGKHYSLFAYDTLLNNRIKAFVVEDDLSAPAAGKAKVRFLQLIPVNVPVDIVANGNILFANRAYADNVNNNSKAAFTAVDGGTYTVDVRIAGSGSSIPPLLTVPNVVFEAGKIYTVYAKGLVTGTGTTLLGAQLIINK